MKDKFLSVYSNCADDIFAHCYEKVAEREVAKYMTRTIFMRTWDLVSSTTTSVLGVRRMLYRTMKSTLGGIAGAGQGMPGHSKNFWGMNFS